MLSDDLVQSKAFSQWVQSKVSVLLSGLFISLIMTVASRHACNAQTYIPADLNFPPTAGSFTYNGAATPPTYTVNGSGGGLINPGFETMQFTETTAAGNLELRARIVSQSSANTGAYPECESWNFLPQYIFGARMEASVQNKNISRHISEYSDCLHTISWSCSGSLAAVFGTGSNRIQPGRVY